MELGQMSDELRNVLVLGQDEARLAAHATIEPVDLLVGLLRHGEGVAALTLAASGLSVQGLRAQARRGADGAGPAGSPVFSRASKEAISVALSLDPAPGPTDLLLGLFRDPGIGEMIGALGLDVLQLRADLLGAVLEESLEGSWSSRS